jgi:sortase A
VFASLVIVILGGLMFIGIDPSQRSAPVAKTNKVERIESPKVDKAPNAVADMEAKKAAEARKAEEAKKAKEEAAAKKKEAAKKAEAKKKTDAASKIPTPPDDALYLTVPAMGRQGDAVSNTNDDAAMDYGAIKLPSSGFPWQPHANTYIAAHVLGYSGTGSYMQFAALPNMAYGDKIYLTDSNGTTYTYEVTNIITVTPYDSWVTAPVPGKDMVTLQTCVNPPAYDQRLIVQGERVAVDTA